MQLSATRAAEARAVLQGNDRGGYTIPTAGLYPFQWNWDASICAVGIQTYDEPRAWQEIETLMRGMWRTEPQTGLLPHIVFHQTADTYFPGPEQWGTQGLRTPATTSISQPPVHAWVVRLLAERTRDHALAQRALQTLVPDLVLHHRWWYETRDPNATGLVLNLHPWETGMDNSPAWDVALTRVPPATRMFKRKDLSHIDADMRPKQSDYERYVTLMDLQRECAFDADCVFQRTPYAMRDIGIVSILHRSTLDLIWLCEQIDLQEPISYLRRRLQHTEMAVLKLWSTRWGQFVSFDTRANGLADVPTHSGLLPLFGELGGGRTATLLSTVEAWLQETPHVLPSTRSSSVAYEPKRYWRGPIWLHINWMIALGCARAGRHDLHDEIRARTLAIIETQGFHEYYNPTTGEGLGGKAFSWAAATMLAW
jgi:hypothetical protein